MKRLLLVALTCAAALCAQTPDEIFKDVPDAPGLPRVLLIGDSISMGYTLPVRELLAGKANVHRIPENGGPTTNGVAHLAQWLGDTKWDVIHFNFGLHDLKIMEGGKRQVPPEDYERNLRDIVAKLVQSGARVVWASTTPVPGGNLSPPRQTADVPAYNLVAKKVMDDNRIPTDDLYAFVLAREKELQLPENVHFTPEGYRALAERVAAAILVQLGK
jgi:acyl-CoA thioesterase-1